MNGNAWGLRGDGLAATVRKVSAALSGSGVDSADAEARMLVLRATGRTREELVLHPDDPLDAPAAERLKAFAARRLAGEPATRIIGARAFWTLDLRVTPDVLDPRPDSETIVAAALQAIAPRRNDVLRILDLGTGSGALLLALLSECPGATGIGVDLSPEACAVARENAERNGLAARAQVRHGRWTDGLAETFDLVVSNPPYIATAAIAGLSIEVRQHDPLLALDGGSDGLAAYREIAGRLPSVLADDGVAVLELGIGQASAVAQLAEQAGLAIRGRRPDLSGIDRALILEFPRAKGARQENFPRPLGEETEKG